MATPVRTGVARDPSTQVFKHVGYVVDDIPQAVDLWVGTVGVGPFFLMEDVSFERLEYIDGPAVYDHSVAFAQWGPICIELMQMTRVEPRSLVDRLAGVVPRPNHIGYAVSDLEEEIAHLEAHGARRYLTAGSGDVQGAMLDAPWLGQSVELLEATAFVTSFTERVASASRWWDGSRPLRPVE